MKKLPLIITLFSLIFIKTSYAQKSSNFFKKKMVIAINQPLLNYSKNYAFLKGMKYENLLGCDSTSVNGAYRTYIPLVINMVNPMELEDAVAYEMLMAKKTGIDGFKFPVFINANNFYIKKYVEIITAYIKTAEERNIDFSFTLDVSFKRNANKISEKEMYDATVRILSELYKSTNFSKKWMRNNQEEIVVFTSYTDNIIDASHQQFKSIRNVSSLTYLNKIRETFDKIESEVNTKLAYVFETKYLSNESYNNRVLDLFAAITISKYALYNENNYIRIAELCRRRNKPVFQVVMPDYLGISLNLKKNNKKLNINSKWAKEINPDLVYLRAHNKKLTYKFRTDLAIAVKNNVDLIDLSSWNYFDDGTHIAPEMHHGYSFGILINYYKNLWINKQEYVEKEVVMTSYKAYDSKYMNKTNVTVKYGQNPFDEGEEDQIEIVTLLNAPAKIYANGDFIGEAKQGINEFLIPKQEGKVKVYAERYGKKFIQYETPKAIISTPERMDWLTYTFTNLDKEMGDYCSDLTASFETNRMYKRFLIDHATQTQWKALLKKKSIELTAALYEFGHIPEEYLKFKNGVNKEYKKDVKKLLSDFHYDVWIELEEEAQKNEGISDILEQKDDVLDGYNILKVSDVN
ncbi:hypothetical protein [Flammeovirga sp. SubArs3]|uniref:hypothetical protein n=1 Tax=Flammeovirga sp. SubArs3 TaxID=2995316 RepID=UPI00248AC8F5|nr:hypothetical protein [Flammeovirga sp. SubArs3]